MPLQFPEAHKCPQALSQFWHSHVFNSWWNCSDGCGLATGLSELSTICAECTAAASLTWKGGCLQTSQYVCNNSLLELPHSGIDPRALGEQHSSRGLISGMIWTQICACQCCPAKGELQQPCATTLAQPTPLSHCPSASAQELESPEGLGACSLLTFS